MRKGRKNKLSRVYSHKLIEEFQRKVKPYRLNKKEVMETCGNNMRKFREASELTLEEMAEILGLAQGYLGLIERENRFLSITKLYKVSRCMNMTLDELLFNSCETNYDKNYYEMKYFIFEQLNRYELQLISMTVKYYLKLRNEVKKL